MNIYLESQKSFVWQWDTRQRVVLEGYPTGTVVHYANCKTQDAPVVETRQEGGLLVADIPPELMQEPHDITIYACDANGTQHCHYIHVFARPKPESYVYEPVEILRYETLSGRIRKLEEQPDEAVTEHNTSTEAHSDMRLELRTLKDRTDIMISAKDIVDNLVTDNHSKPLSAAQGVALKEMIDGQGPPDWNQNNPDAPGYIMNRTHYSYVKEGLVSVELDDTGPLVDALFCAELYEHRHDAVFIIGDTEYRIGDSAGSNEASWSYCLVDENGRSGDIIYCYASGENDIDIIDSISIRNNGTGAYIKGTIKYTKQLESVKSLDSKYLPFLMSLGIHTDGLLYLFIDGKPYGSGIPVVRYY